MRGRKSRESLGSVPGRRCSGCRDGEECLTWHLQGTVRPTVARMRQAGGEQLVERILEG